MPFLLLITVVEELWSPMRISQWRTLIYQRMLLLLLNLLMIMKVESWLLGNDFLLVKSSKPLHMVIENLECPYIFFMGLVDWYFSSIIVGAGRNSELPDNPSSSCFMVNEVLVVYSLPKRQGASCQCFHTLSTCCPYDTSNSPVILSVHLRTPHTGGLSKRTVETCLPEASLWLTLMQFPSLPLLLLYNVRDSEARAGQGRPGP